MTDDDECGEQRGFPKKKSSETRAVVEKRAWWEKYIFILLYCKTRGNLAVLFRARKKTKLMMSSDAVSPPNPTPQEEVVEEQIGTVHWEPLNDIKSKKMVPEESPPMRRTSRSPPNRNLSTSIYDFNQDAYDAIDHGTSSSTRPPSYSRSTSMDNAAPLEAPWNSNSSVLGGTNHSGSAAPPSKSKGKKSKETPLIPAAQLSEEGDSGDRIRLGICAMDKKARSKPMAEILSRLDEKDFQVVFFGDDMILNRPVEEWPICDVVIAFFSKGYPLPKAKEYVALRKPFILNDLQRQEVSMWL